MLYEVITDQLGLGSNFLFKPLGETDLKGRVESIKLFAVYTQENADPNSVYQKAM